MRKITWETQSVKFFEILSDVLLIVISFITSLSIIYLKWPTYFFSDSEMLKNTLWTVSFIFLCSIVFFRIYRISMFSDNYLRNILKIVFSLVFVSLLLVVFQLIYADYLFSITSSFLMIPIAIALLSVTKYIFYLFLKKVNVKYAMVCGPKGEAEAISKKILFNDNRFTVLKYIVFDTFDMKQVDLLFKCINEVDDVYLTENLSTKMKNTIISYCFRTQKPYYLVPKLYELALTKSTMAQISDTMVFGVKGLGLTIEQRIFKRFFDLIVSLIVFVVFSPLMLFISIFIKLYDRGPVLFKQKRMTRHNRVFTLYKFRSMIPDAEKDTGAIQAAKNDKRITPLGRVLRATRLDELPQLFNVITGDMSLVGPRALRVEEMEEYTSIDSDFSYRLNVKAGVTGYAQTMGKYYTHFKDKLHFDIFYIVNYSFFNDVVIILHTARMIFDPASSEGKNVIDTISNCLESRGYSLKEMESQDIKLVEKK